MFINPSSGQCLVPHFCSRLDACEYPAIIVHYSRRHPSTTSLLIHNISHVPVSSHFPGYRL